MVETGATLVVIDPLMAALAGDVKTGFDHHIRKALAPLRSMAERTRAAVVIIRHFNKNTKINDPILRGGGSIGIIGAVRAGLIVGTDPDDPSCKVLAVSKCNLAPEGQPSLRYRVVTDDEYGVGAIEWLGKTDRTARDLLDPDNVEDLGGQIGEAVSVLGEFLKHGPRLATECKYHCGKEGVADRTLDRAKDRLGVRSRLVANGKAKAWWWELPE